MRTKTSKVVIMLFIALLQCSVAFSATDATTPVPLYYYKYNPPVVDGTNGPRKNPPHQLTLSVLFDHDNGQLIFEDPQGPSCNYSVVCADGSIVTEGFMDFELQNSAQAYKSVKWMDGRGENLGEKSSVVVNPKATGYDYSVVAMTEEGDMCTGSITLEKDGGIKSVGNPTPERLIVALETPAPAMATLLVTSVLDGTCVISCPVAEGAENVSLDTSRLSRGVYVVSYSVNSELIDQKKVRLD